MIKAVIFDMYETLITHYNSPLYMGKQIAQDMKLEEGKFREIWNTSDDDRTLGKRTLEDVIEEILLVNNRYSKELFELIVSSKLIVSSLASGNGCIIYPHAFCTKLSFEKLTPRKTADGVCSDVTK